MDLWLFYMALFLACVHSFLTIDKAEVDRLKRNNKVLIIVVIICLVLAIVATIVAIYALAKDDKNGDDEPRENGNGAMRSSACDGIDCLHGGTCTNLYGDNYMCSCVPPFYGRKCEIGNVVKVP